MFELTLLTAVVLVVVLALRRSKTVILENPVIIQRTGEYYFTLAPRLNHAQPLLERIAQQCSTHRPFHDDSETLYRRVYDPHVSTSPDQYYLLALTLRQNILYFQVIPPNPPHDLSTLQQFAQAVLADLPPARNTDATALLQTVLAQNWGEVEVGEVGDEKVKGEGGRVKGEE